MCTVIVCSSVWQSEVVETMYSNQGLADMHFMYSLADGNAIIMKGSQGTPTHLISLPTGT
jgi:hypothetical protein